MHKLLKQRNRLVSKLERAELTYLSRLLAVENTLGLEQSSGDLLPVCVNAAEGDPPVTATFAASRPRLPRFPVLGGTVHRLVRRTGFCCFLPDAPDPYDDTHFDLDPESVPSQHHSAALRAMRESQDAIRVYAHLLAHLNTHIEQRQAAVRVQSKARPGAVILFHRQLAAHVAAQVLTHDHVWHAAEKTVDVAAEDLIWPNLGLSVLEREVRGFVQWVLVLAIILFWTFPAAFVSGISSISSLSEVFPLLKFVYNLDPKTVAVIEGVVPAAALAALVSLVPLLLSRKLFALICSPLTRKLVLAEFKGLPKRSRIYLSVMKTYFGFQMVNVFLVVTISK